MTNQKLRQACNAKDLEDDTKAGALVLEIALSLHEALERIADEIEHTRIVLRDLT